MADYNVIQRQVQKNHGVSGYTLGQLRDVLGYTRLGNVVVQEIRDGLAHVGLAWYPEPTNNNQNESVWVYEVGSHFNTLLTTITHPNQSANNLMQSFIKAKKLFDSYEEMTRND